MELTGVRGYFFRMSIIAIAVTLVFAATGLSANEDPSTIIQKYFDDLDSYLVKMSKGKEMRSRLVVVDNFFVSESEKHPEITSFIRTNSKGKVVNEVVSGKLQDREYRDIARQSWYSQTVDNLKPYYGRLKKGQQYFLFWTKPIKIRTKSGSTRSGGALAAKIDLKKSFETISSKIKSPFLITLDRKTLHSNNWDNTAISKTADLKVEGVTGLTVKYTVGEGEKKTSDITSKRSATVASANAKPAAGSAKKADTTKKAEGLLGPAPDKEKTLIENLIMPAIIVVVAVLLFVVMSLIGKAIQKRNQRLIDAVESDFLPPGDSKRIVFTKTEDQKKAPPPKKDEPAAPPPPPAPEPVADLEEIDEVIDLEEAMAAAQKQTPPPVPPPPPPPPEPPKPPVKPKSPPIQPEPAVSIQEKVSHIDKEQYQQMKKEIYQEAVQYMKSEFEKEYNARLMQKLDESRQEIQQVLQRDMQNSIGAYNQELAGLMESMTSILTESEQNIIQKNQQLKEVVERIKQRMDKGI